MSTGALISVAAATGLLDAIARAGGDPAAVLASAGLERGAFENADRFIAAAAFSRMLEEAARGTGDACFGLHFGERFDPKDTGALAYVVVNSPTIAVAIENIERYVHLHNNAARVFFRIEGEQAYLRYLLADSDAGSRGQQNEFSMAVLVNTFRVVAGADWAPWEVQFAHEAPADAAEHARVFRSGVRFGCACNALVLEHDFVERVVPTADPRLYRILKQHVERVFGEMPRRNDLPGTVRRAIAECMRDGEPSLARVARRLSLTPRTLERRLSEAGAVYRDLVNDTRRRFAVAYLKERRRTLTEIAFLLGYSEVSAFNRAFKRWTGATPSEYRTGAPGPRARVA